MPEFNYPGTFAIVSDAAMTYPNNLYFDKIDEHLAYFSNSILEERALDDSEFVVLHELGVARTEMLQVKVERLFHIIPNRLAEPYRARLDDAETNGLITYEEELELRSADVVDRGYSRQDMKTPVWLVAEVSVAITPGDIRRARERADILSRALTLSETVIPLAYGIRASDEIRAIAEESGVRIALQPPSDDKDNYT